ncbi:YitT family ABC transporter [Spiroplasma endosymbiont of Labia minor]|uniref:YitT family ABC transporter n=1 Tax=Spiroplasma endosymbiont of Labia minor TaxID=3066305 RepID=UPI0030CF83C7
MDENKEQNDIKTYDQSLSNVEIDNLAIKEEKPSKTKKKLNKNQSLLVSRKQQQIIISNYFKFSFAKELLSISIGVLIVTVAFDYFISSTGSSGLFPSGMGAIARFFAVLTFQNSIQMQGTFYFVYYFVLNIPLIIFGAVKLGWKLTLTTILYMVESIAFDQILTRIPFVNPQEFHFIFNYKLINNLSMSWSSSIWLFIFGAIGGALLGYGYGFIYRVGSSTGGTDFVTMYFSRKKDISIGTINRDVNFGILAIVIISNTAVLPTNQIPSDIKLSAIWDLNRNDLNSLIFYNGEQMSFAKALLLDAILHSTYIGENGVVFNSELINTFKSSGLSNDSIIFHLSNIYNNINLDNSLNFLLDSANTSSDSWHSVWHYASTTSLAMGFDSFPTTLLLKIKFIFIFGPSFFASLVLVIVNALITNLVYPKYKIRTIIIATKMQDEIVHLLNKDGVQNDIMSWNVVNNTSGNYLHRSIIMVSMSVMNWEPIEKEIFHIDPQARITQLRTKSIKGFFKYDVKKNDEFEIPKTKTEKENNEIEKIRQVALVRANKHNQKMSKLIRALRKKTLWQQEHKDQKELKKSSNKNKKNSKKYK